jgi:F0F1-type ATP synthase epsilon subunit
MGRILRFVIYTMIDVVIYTLEKVIFEGKAENIIFPGERGVFEVLPYHKPLLSRLVGGKVIVDQHIFPIRCGIAGINHNKATVVIEEP